MSQLLFQVHTRAQPLGYFLLGVHCSTGCKIKLKFQFAILYLTRKWVLTVRRFR